MTKLDAFLKRLGKDPDDVCQEDVEALVKMVKLLRRHVSVFERDRLNINCLDAELEALVPEE